MRWLNIGLMLLIVIVSACSGKGVETRTPRPIGDASVELSTTAHGSFVLSFEDETVTRYDVDGSVLETVNVTITVDVDGHFSVPATFSDSTEILIEGEVDEEGRVGELSLYINGVQVSISDGEKGDDSSEKGDDGAAARFKKVVTGDFHACAISENNNLWCWGSNGAGQLGVETLSEKAKSPKKVSDIVDVVDVALGSSHTCAQTQDGKVYCWGGGKATTPKHLDNIPSDLSSLSAGGNRTCAIDSVGRIGCWALSENLADTTVEIEEDLSMTNYVSVVNEHFCFTEENGAVHCRDYEGNTTLSSQIFKGSLKVTVGLNHVCALYENGKVFCSGANEKGQLGNDSQDYSETSVEVQDLSNVVDIQAGANHTCAITDAASLYCWGDNSIGQISSSGVSFYKTAKDVKTLVQSVSCSPSYTCTITISGNYECWGDNSFGQLGSL